MENERNKTIKTDSLDLDKMITYGLQLDPKICSVYDRLY